MLQGKLKKMTLAGAFVSALLLNGCTPEEQAFATGAAVGALGTAVVYSYPYYYDRPYYYYHGHYYYGGHYHHGYYYHHGHRYYGGHYYNNGYRYYNGRRYRAEVGRYGYYRSREEYRHYRNGRNNRYRHNTIQYRNTNVYQQRQRISTQNRHNDRQTGHSTVYRGTGTRGHSSLGSREGRENSVPDQGHRYHNRSGRPHSSTVYKGGTENHLLAHKKGSQQFNQSRNHSNITRPRWYQQKSEINTKKSLHKKKVKKTGNREEKRREESVERESRTRISIRNYSHIVRSDYR